jgi:hypothetical protein
VEGSQQRIYSSRYVLFEPRKITAVLGSKIVLDEGEVIYCSYGWRANMKSRAKSFELRGNVDRCARHIRRFILAFRDCFENGRLSLAAGHTSRCRTLWKGENEQPNTYTDRSSFLR